MFLPVAARPRAPADASTCEATVVANSDKYPCGTPSPVDCLPPRLPVLSAVANLCKLAALTYLPIFFPEAIACYRSGLLATTGPPGVCCTPLHDLVPGPPLQSNTCTFPQRSFK